MRPHFAIVLAAVILAALPGCRVFERLTKDRSPADAASRNKDKEKDKDWLRERQDREFDSTPPKDWLNGPAPAGRGNRVPESDSRSGESTSNSRRGVSGIVVDEDGRPVPNTYVTVENVDPAKAGGGAPMGVETDTTGFFEIRGLKADEVYDLSASISRGGVTQAGRTQARVPKSSVRLQLHENHRLPARVGSPRPADTGDLPPSASTQPETRRPDPVIPSLPPSNTHEGSPLGPGTIPETPSSPRGDLITNGPTPDTRINTPPAAIPGPTAPPLVPLVPSVPPPSSSRSLPREARFGLLDESGKLRVFPSGRENDLVLLDFMTTTCLPCKKAIPTLTKLNERYSGRGVELIAVCCDGGSEPRRLKLANQYREDNSLRYAVYAEASGANGVRERFQVESYPTLVLIDGNGKRLWTGHPADSADLEKVLKQKLTNR